MNLIAIATDEAAAERTKEKVNDILSQQRIAVLSVITTTREESRQWALLAQSLAGRTRAR